MPRYLDQGAGEPFLVALGEHAAGAARRDRERRQRRELAGERLGRGDPDFRAGQRRHHDVAFPRNGRTRHVDDGKDVLPVLARIAQRRERVGGLARLRNEDREVAGIERDVAVAEFGGDVDLDREPRKTLEPVARDHAGIVGGAARCDRNALERAEIERQRHRQRDAFRRHVEVFRQRVADHFRLLVDLLGHEVAVIALVDEHHRGLRLEHRAPRHLAPGIVNLGALTGDDDPVAVLQIADGVGEGRERNRVGADEHRALAETDRERRAFARANQQILLAGEEEGERKSPPQPRQCRGHRLDRRQPVLDPVGDQMRDDFAVGLGRKLGTLPFQLAAQLAEVLDDAVVHHGEPVGRVRMGVVLGRTPVRCPAGVADADRAGERFARELCFEVLELAFGAPPRQRAVAPASPRRPNRSRGTRGA